MKYLAKTAISANYVADKILSTLENWWKGFNPGSKTRTHILQQGTRLLASKRIKELKKQLTKQASQAIIRRFLKGLITLEDVAKASTHSGGTPRLIKQLGSGAEGVADLMTMPGTPQGIGVKKSYDVFKGPYTGKNLMSKIDLLKKYKKDPRFAEFYGQTPNKPITWHEYIPGITGHRAQYVSIGQIKPYIRAAKNTPDYPKDVFDVGKPFVSINKKRPTHNTSNVVFDPKTNTFKIIDFLPGKSSSFQSISKSTKTRSISQSQDVIRRGASNHFVEPKLKYKLREEDLAGTSEFSRGSHLEDLIRARGKIVDYIQQNRANVVATKKDIEHLFRNRRGDSRVHFSIENQIAWARRNENEIKKLKKQLKNSYSGSVRKYKNSDQVWKEIYHQLHNKEIKVR